MKGGNTLQLNKRTIMEAIQEYVDKRLVTKNQEVTGVSWNGADYVVALKEKVDEPVS